MTYTDTDGDHVTITFSTPLFGTQTAATDGVLGLVFHFDKGAAHIGAANTTDDVPQQLQTIDLTNLLGTNGNPASGASIIFSVQKSGGDGLVNVGAIQASNISLGVVAIPGDLGQIDAGSGNSSYGVQALYVDTLGKLINTQSGTPDYESTIAGGLGSFNALSVEGGYLHVVNGYSSSGTSVSSGQIGAVNIAHYLKPRDPAVAGTNDGVIQTDGSIGSIHLGSNFVDSQHPELSDGLNGGAGTNSGSIIAGTNIGSIVIGGSLRGGTATGSGSVSAGGGIGYVQVGEVLGSGAGSANIHAVTGISTAVIGTIGSPGLVGGTGDGSGVISGDGGIGALYISNIQGAGPDSGGVVGKGGLGAVTVYGSVHGGAGAHSGFIESGGQTGNVVIDGDLAGYLGTSAASHSGILVSSGAIGDVTVGGTVIGGDGDASGGIFSGTSGSGGIGSVIIKDGLLGGAGTGSGVVSSAAEIASVSISHTAPAGLVPDAIAGGSGASSGTVYATGAIGSVVVSGHLHGGVGDDSGSIQEHGLISSLSVSGGILGGGGARSGAVEAFDNQTTGTAGAIYTASIGNITGGSGLDSGMVSSDGGIFSIATNSLAAGTAAGSGQVLAGAGVFATGDIGYVAIGAFGSAATSGSNPTVAVPGGTIDAYGGIYRIATYGMFKATVHAGYAIGSVLVGGDVTNAAVTALGQAASDGVTDSALGELLVQGNVSGSNFLAGYSITGAPVNGHAQIGLAEVGGNWTASNLVAGVEAAAANSFGTSGDAAIPITDGSNLHSRIGSILIAGQVSGSAAAGDHFGFVAHQIGPFQSAAGQVFVDKLPTKSQDLATTTTNDVTIREV